MPCPYTPVYSGWGGQSRGQGLPTKSNILKGNQLSSPRSHQLWAGVEGWWTPSSSMLKCWLAWSCADNHSYHPLKWMQRTCCGPPLYLSAPSSAMVPQPGRQGDLDVGVSYLWLALHRYLFDQLWVMLTTTHCKKKLLCWGQRELLVLLVELILNAPMIFNFTLTIVFL